MHYPISIVLKISGSMINVIGLMNMFLWLGFQFDLIINATS